MTENLPEPPESQSPADRSATGSEFIFYAALFEGSLIGLALLLGWLGLCDPAQPLHRLSWSEQLRPALIWGLLGTVPLVVLLFSIERIPIWPFRQLSEVTKELVEPLFRGTAIHELLLVSLLAGLGEELLFRWAIQGGLGASGGGPLAQVLALLFASLLFGLCHYLNQAYALFTFAIGIYFGCLMWLAGTWIAPAIAHAVYDFIALIYLTRKVGDD
ncbi:MAG: type II CAAX prenyl endopeptidase Rce1 family protein [Planctomycetota bacterium]|jgi:membrane protease YdiL (CAAX protease family)